MGPLGITRASGRCFANHMMVSHLDTPPNKRPPLAYGRLTREEFF